MDTGGPSRPTPPAPTGPLTSIGVLHPTFESWGGAEWFIHSILQRLADLKIGVTLYTHRFDEPPDDRARYRVVAHRGGGVLTGPWDWKRIAGRLASSLRSHEVLFVHNHPATLWYRSLQEMGGAPPAVWYCHEPPVSLYGLEEEGERATGRMTGPDSASDAPGGARPPGRAANGRSGAGASISSGALARGSRAGIGARRPIASARFYGADAPGRILSRVRLRAAILGSGGSPAWRERMRRLDRDAVGRHAAILANSRHTAARVRKLYGRDAAIVPPLPPDLDSFAPLPGGAKEPLVLCVGRLEEAKRPLLLLEAWSRARKSDPRLADVRLVFVGDGHLRERLLARIGELSLGGAVESLRGLPRREVAAWMRRALVSVHLGIAEPFGLVPLESMAAGTAVLAEWSGGVRETVVPGVTGWTGEDLDEGSLAALLLRLPSARAELEAMGARAAEHVRRSFDFARTFRDLLAHLSNAAGRLDPSTS